VGAETEAAARAAAATGATGAARMRRARTVAAARAAAVVSYRTPTINMLTPSPYPPPLLIPEKRTAKLTKLCLQPTHKLGRCFLCVCCVLVRCVWVFAGCVCV